MRSVKALADPLRLQLWDRDFTEPAETLACDEALLDVCDASDNHPGFLRLWESPDYFVVLGYGKHIAEEVFREECQELNVPILRRCSGGGTVLQGPGCVNYTLVLPISSVPELESITTANRFIMQRILRGITGLTTAPPSVHGYTDLVWNGRKFSGNAQRRKRRCLLFHGTFLVDFNLAMISRTLRSPAQQPEYRGGRNHAEFLTNLPVARTPLQAALVAEWGAIPEMNAQISEQVTKTAGVLVNEKYATKEWNERF